MDVRSAMPDHMDHRYPTPAAELFDLALAIVTGTRRRFKKHALGMIARLDPVPLVIGEPCIPQNGPGVITVNHYYRPGFWAPWLTAVISAVVPKDIYWTMADAFTYPDQPFGRLKRYLSHQVLIRVAHVYEFNSMPPMPPSPLEVRERARSVQRLMQAVREQPEILLGLAPEGGDQPGGVLSLPPEGFGKLALFLAERGMRFYPVGVYEESGKLVVHFGEGYYLPIDQPDDRRQADLLARTQVMTAVAACLPVRLRGIFGQGS